jgi:hypothetical protein
VRFLFTHLTLPSLTDQFSLFLAAVKRHYLDKFFYTYGLNWDSKGLRTWMSKPSRATEQVDFNQPFWTRGQLYTTTINSTVAVNPWTESKYPKAAPFDEEFYLILSVAVGGTNGWFPDDGVKPWGNGAPHAMRDLYVSSSPSPL